MQVILHQLYDLIGDTRAALVVHCELQPAVRVEFGDAGAGAIKQIPGIAVLSRPADLILVGDLPVVIQILRYGFGHLDGPVDSPCPLVHERIRILQPILVQNVFAVHNTRRCVLGLEAHIPIDKIQLIAERNVGIEGVVPPLGLQPVERGNVVQIIQSALDGKHAAVVQAGIDDLIFLRAAGQNLRAHGLLHRAARTLDVVVHELFDDLDVQIVLHEIVAFGDCIVHARGHFFVGVIVRIFFVLCILGFDLALAVRGGGEYGQRAAAVVPFFNIVPNRFFGVRLRRRRGRFAGRGGRARRALSGAGGESQHKQQRRQAA